MIESYSFGNIVVNGKRFFRDLIVFPDRIKENWWRREGHRLSLEDLEEVISYQPETLVIGTGYFGVMKIPDEIQKFIKEKNIELVISGTKEAVKKFNQLLEEGKKVVGAFHLTC